MQQQDDASSNTVNLLSRPALKRFVRLHEDKGRGRTVLLAPEQVLTPNAVALEVLKLCDGVRNVDEIAATLSERYDADQEQIVKDILPVLQDLADNGMLNL
ncbi:MAG: pyrroloquinoline quinone biosynthesis peptide chaperone PqqD [Hyphomicrobiaceae bacterium]